LLACAGGAYESTDERSAGGANAVRAVRASDKTSDVSDNELREQAGLRVGGFCHA